MSLTQVFMNLIGNSIDAMPEGGTVEVFCTENEGFVDIHVKDSGMGMSEDVLARVFEPFYSTKGVGAGTGLGLHIVKNEVEKQNGKITVSSQEGVGTEFVVSLPGMIPTEQMEAA